MPYRQPQAFQNALGIMVSILPISNVLKDP